MPYLASDIPLHPTRICIEYTAPHSNQDFTVPFPFLQRDHVYVQYVSNGLLEKVDVSFTWSSDGLVRLKDGITINGDFIIFRYTPRNALYRVFNDATSISAKEFNEALEALLYAIQEGEEVTAIVDELVNLGHLTQEVRDRLLPSANDRNNLLPTAPNEGDRDGKILEYVGNNREWVHVDDSASHYELTKSRLFNILKEVLIEGRGIDLREIVPGDEIQVNVENHRYVPTVDEIFPRFESIIKAGDGIRLDQNNIDHELTIVNTREGGSSDLDEQLGTKVHLLEGYSYLPNPGIVKGQFTVHTDGNIAIAVKDGQTIPEDFRAPGTFIKFNETQWQIMQEVLPQTGATRTFRVRKTIDAPIFPTTGNISFTRGIQGRVLTLENRVDYVDNNHFDPTQKNFFDGISPVIQAGNNVELTRNSTTNEITIASTGGGSSDLEGVINPATISVTAPTSSFTVAQGASRALEVTSTSGGGYVRKTNAPATTITLSKQATYEVFATVTVKRSSGNGNSRIGPTLIPTGDNVTLLSQSAPYIRTDNGNTYTVSISATFTTNAVNSVVGLSIGHRAGFQNTTFLLTAISNIRILPLIGATGPKGDKGDAGPTYDETKNVRGQVSFFYSDGTTESISRFHPTQLRRLFGATSGAGISPTARRTDIRFLISGFIPGFTSLSQLQSLTVSGQPARSRTAALEKGEFIGGNLFFDAVKVPGAFALIGTLTNAELNNFINNSGVKGFEVTYSVSGQKDIWSRRIPTLTATEATAAPVVPHIPIESVKRGIDIDQVKQTFGTATRVGNNYEVSTRLQLNSANTKAAISKIVVPVGSSSSGGGILKVAQLPTTSINENATYFQMGNGVSGTAAPGLYVRHSGSWQVVSKHRLRLGTATINAGSVSQQTLISTGIQVHQMDDQDRLIFTFDSGIFQQTDEKVFEWEWVKGLLTGTANTAIGDSRSNRQIEVTDADGTPIIRIRLTSYTVFPATILVATKTNERGSFKMNAYRQ